MDRHGQQSSQHQMRDRPMTHPTAPSQQSQQQQQQPPPPGFPHFNHPPTAQPPIQMPFTDPFQNRDPFMPSAHSRRGSYGMAPGSAPAGTPRYGERAWSAQPQGMNPTCRLSKSPSVAQKRQHGGGHLRWCESQAVASQFLAPGLVSGPGAGLCGHSNA